MCGDNDEASDLALEPVLRTKPKTVRAQPGPPAHEPVAGYPPIRLAGARLKPEWLSGKEFEKVLSLQSRGKNILEMAHAVNKNASLLRIYVDTYLKDVSPLPLHSANSTNSSDSPTYSASDSRGSEDGLFPLDEETTVPQEGMPDPSFLNREEQERVWVMFQQNNTVRTMAKGLHKNRQKLSQYINAYMRPKLLRLQAEERAAEDAATPTPITPQALTGGISQFPPSNHVAPITAATSSAPLTGSITRSLTPQTVAPIAAAPGPTSSQDSCFQENDDAKSYALLFPMLSNAPAAVPESIYKTNDEMPDNDAHQTNGEVVLLRTTKSASDEDSLFGDSPVDVNHVGSPHTPLVSTHHEVEPAQPTPRKRRFEHNSETPRRVSKRLRHRSFP